MFKQRRKSLYRSRSLAIFLCFALIFSSIYLFGVDMAGLAADFSGYSDVAVSDDAGAPDATRNDAQSEEGQWPDSGDEDGNDGNGNDGNGNDGNGNDGNVNDGNGNDGNVNDENGNDGNVNDENGNDENGNDENVDDEDEGGVKDEPEENIDLKRKMSAALTTVMPLMFYLTAEKDADGKIIINQDQVTYCLDMNLDFVGGVPYFPDMIPVDEKVLFVINNSYPVLTLEQTKFLWGLSDLSEKEAYDSTQLAIWKYTNLKNPGNPVDGASFTEHEKELSTNAKALYVKLTDGADKQVTGYQPGPRFEVNLDASGADKDNAKSTAGNIVYGPYAITSNIPDSLKNQFYLDFTASSASGNPADPDYDIVDGSGVSSIIDSTSGKISMAESALATGFYISFNAAFKDDFTLTFTLAGPNEEYANLPYVTETGYLWGYLDSALTQPILNYSVQTGQPQQALDLIVNNDQTINKAELTLKKDTATMTGTGEEFPIKAYVMDGGDTIDTLDVGSLTIGGTDIAVDLSPYTGKGYNVIVVEEWENRADKYDGGSGDYFITRTTSVGAGGNGPSGTEKYLAVNAANNSYDVTAGEDTKPTNGGYYRGYEFALDNSAATGLEITFANDVAEKTPEDMFPGVVVKKEFTTYKTDGSQDDREFTFYLYGYNVAEDEYEFLDTFSLKNNENKDILTAIIWPKYAGKADELEGTTFAIVEGYEYSKVGVYENRTEVYEGTNSTESTLGYASSNLQDGVSKELSYDVAAPYPGVEFTLFNADAAQTFTFGFKNHEEDHDAKVIIEKTFDTDNTSVPNYQDEHLFTFSLYEVADNAGNPAYELVGSFTLRNNETKDIVSTTLMQTKYPDNAYIGKTFVVVESSYAQMTDPYQPYKKYTTITTIGSGGEEYYEISAGSIVGKTSVLTDGYYPGLEVTIQEDDDVTVTFNNKEEEQKEPVINVDKSFTDNGITNSTGNNPFAFYLCEIDNNGEYEVIKNFYVNNNEFEEIFRFIKNDSSNYFGEKFAIIEAWENTDPSSQVYLSTTRGTAISLTAPQWSTPISYDEKYYSITVNPTTQAVIIDSDNEWAASFPYLGVEFTLTPDNRDITVTFANTKQDYPSPPVITLEKYNQTSSYGSFEFDLYHVDANGIHTKIGSSITLGVNSSESDTKEDIFEMILNATEASTLYPNGYYGETFVIVENWPSTNNLYGESNRTAVTAPEISDGQPIWYSDVPIVATADSADFFSEYYQYPAYQFTLSRNDFISDTGVKITFENYLEPAPEAPTIELTKSSLSSAEGAFYLFAKDSSSFDCIGEPIYVSAGATDTDVIFDAIESVYSGSYYDMTFVLVEAYENTDYYSSPYKKTTVDVTGAGASNKYFYNLTTEISPSITTNSETNYSASCPYPGVEFELTGDHKNIAITFTNQQTSSHQDISISLEKSYAGQSGTTQFDFALYGIGSSGSWTAVKDDIQLTSGDSVKIFDIIQTQLSTSYLDYEYVLIEKNENKYATYDDIGYSTSVARSYSSGASCYFSKATPTNYISYSLGSDASISTTSTLPYYPGINFTLNKNYILNNAFNSNSSNPSLTITFENYEEPPIDPVVNVAKEWAGDASGSNESVTLYILEVDNNNDEVMGVIGSITRSSADTLLDIINDIKDNVWLGDYRGKTYVIYEEYPQQSDTDSPIQSTEFNISATNNAFLTELNVTPGYITASSTPYINGNTITINNTSSTDSYPAVMFTFPADGVYSNDDMSVTITFTNSYTELKDPNITITKAWSPVGSKPAEYTNADPQFYLYAYDGSNKKYMYGSESGGTFTPTLLDRMDINSNFYSIVTNPGAKYYSVDDYTTELASDATLTFELAENYPYYQSDLLYGSRSTMVGNVINSNSKWAISETHSTDADNTGYPSIKFKLPTQRLTTEQPLAVTFTNSYTPSDFAITAEKDGTARYVRPSTSDTAVKSLYLYRVDGDNIAGQAQELNFSPGTGNSVDVTAVVKTLLSLSGVDTVHNQTFLLVEDYPIDPADGKRSTGITLDNIDITDWDEVYTIIDPSSLEAQTSSDIFGVKPDNAPYYTGVKFTIPAGITDLRTNITFTNEDADAYLQAIRIEKQDDDGGLLTGAKFKIFEMTGGTVDNPVYDEKAPLIVSGTSTELETDSFGIAKSDYIFEIGKTYVIVETEVPAGMDPSMKDMVVAVVTIQDNISGNITDSNIEIVTITDYRVGSFTLHKLNSKGGVPLPGAEFNLYMWEDDTWGYDDYLTSGTLIRDGVAVADSGTGVGTALVDYLRYGTYVLIETAAPTGYQINKNVQKVVINNVQSDPSYVLNYPVDTELGKIQIVKVDERVYGEWSAGEVVPAANRLAGAEFSVYIEITRGGQTEKVVIGTLDWDAATGAYSIELPANNYYLKETTSPVKYKDNGVEYQFTVTDGGSVTPLTIVGGSDAVPQDDEGNYVMPNEPFKGSLTLKKVDESDTSKTLSDAEFTVYLSNGQYYGVMTYTDNGNYTLTNIPAGSYYVEETKAPAGYENNDAEYYFQIENDGDAAELYADLTMTTDKIAGNRITNKQTSSGGGNGGGDDGGGGTGGGVVPGGNEDEDEDGKTGGGTVPGGNEDEDGKTGGGTIPDGNEGEDGNTGGTVPGGNEDEDGNAGGSVPGGDNGIPPVGPGTQIVPHDDGSYDLIAEDGTVMRLVPDGDDYRLVDENGVPFGRWHYDPEKGIWIFEPETPLGIPQAGRENGYLYFYTIVGLYATYALGVRRYRRQKRV